MASTAYTYNDNAMREDLLDIITNISPKVTQLSSGLGTSTAKAIRHEWLVKSLGAVKSNAYIEGADASYAVQDPTRVINYCQIIRQGYEVTDTERAVNRAGYADRMAEEASDAMSTWKNDLELAILQGSLACGSTTAARSMKGIRNWIVATNVTNQSGISLAEATFVAYLERVWNYGAEVDEVYVGAKLKTRIDGWTASSTKNIDAEDKRLVNAIDIYESSFAPIVKLFLHRYADEEALLKTITNAHMIIGIDSQYYKTSYLRKPSTRDLAKVGDAQRAEVYGEVTLEDRTGGKAGFVGEYHF